MKKQLGAQKPHLVCIGGSHNGFAIPKFVTLWSKPTFWCLKWPIFRSIIGLSKEIFSFAANVLAKHKVLPGQSSKLRRSNLRKVGRSEFKENREHLKLVLSLVFNACSMFQAEQQNIHTKLFAVRESVKLLANLRWQNWKSVFTLRRTSEVS